MSKHLSAWDCEDLAEAVLLKRGASHTEKAAPRRTKKRTQGKSEAVPAFDLFEGCFDVVGLFPDYAVALDAYSGRDDTTVSEKMAHISSHGPWPSYWRPQVWHWRRKDLEFHIWTLVEGEWMVEEPEHVPHPRALLDRFDVSLG